MPGSSLQSTPGAKTAYLSLGSNLGDRAGSIAGAIAAMPAGGIRIVRSSSLYMTEPVDLPAQPWFLNAAVEVKTLLMPRQLLKAIRRIETTFGRKRNVPRGPRTLDLDILLFGTSIIHTAELEVPHPRLPMRRFVLVPLAEIAPTLRHPVLGKTMVELLAVTPDHSQVRLVGAAGELEQGVKP